MNYAVLILRQRLRAELFNVIGYDFSPQQLGDHRSAQNKNYFLNAMKNTFVPIIILYYSRLGRSTRTMITVIDVCII